MRFPLLVLASGLLMGHAAHAENDYEFAAALLKKDSLRFPTGELTARLLARLDAQTAPPAQHEAILIRAAQRCRQAQYSSPELAVALRTEADQLYTRFLAVAQGHRLYSEARRQYQANQWELSKKVLQLPANARNAKARDEALRSLQQLAEDTRKENEPLRKELDARHAATKRFWEERPEALELPPALSQPMERALETYVPADQKYIQACLNIVEAIPDLKAEQRKLADALTKYCAAQLDSEVIGYSPMALAWYHFAKGRVHATVRDEAAAEAEFRAVEEILSTSCRHPLERQILKATFAEWIELKFALERHAEVIAMVELLRAHPVLKEVFKEPAGARLNLMEARAYVRQPDSGKVEYEQAIRVLSGMIAEGSPASSEAAQALAEVLGNPQARNLRLQVAPREWYAAGHGFYLKADAAHRRYRELQQEGNAHEAQAVLAVARAEFSRALECHRRAVAQARQPGGDPAARLAVEADAWAEIAECYLKSEAFAEAMIACQAFLDTFSSDARAKWLPDATREKGFYGKPEVKKALARLDQPGGGLERARREMLWAYAEHGRRARTNLLPSPVLNEDDKLLKEGRAACESSTRHQTQAQALLNEKQPEKAAAEYAQAVKDLEDAAARFEKVTAASSAGESAVYQAATCYVLAERLAAEGKLGARVPPQEARTRAQALARKAQDAFQRYADRVAANAATSEEVRVRRRELGRDLPYWRAWIHYGLKDLGATLRACDEYLQVASPDTRRRGEAAFLRVRAACEWAAAQTPPQADPVLHETAQAAAWLKEDAAYRPALSMLAYAWRNTATKAEKAKLEPARIGGYYGQAATFLAVQVEADPGATLDEWYRLAAWRLQASQARLAADALQALLRKFDPQNKNARMDDAQWPAMLGILCSVCRDDDLNRWERGKQDHAALVDFLYETSEGAALKDTPEKRPPHDRYPVDYPKALAQLATIRRNYPNCGTLDPAKGKDGKGWLQLIEEEIVFRQRVLAARSALVDAALRAAAELAEAGKPEEAKKYRAMADRQLEMLIELNGPIPELLLKSARARIANGDYARALKMLEDLRDQFGDPADDRYIEAKRLISEVYYAMGEYAQAADYPEGLLLMRVEDPWMRKHWPDLRGFLEKCYAKGAPRPKTK
jgi:hypothetical protein